MSFVMIVMIVSAMGWGSKILWVRDPWDHFQDHAPGVFLVPTRSPKPQLHTEIRLSAGFVFHPTLLMRTLFSSLKEENSAHRKERSRLEFDRKSRKSKKALDAV